MLELAKRVPSVVAGVIVLFCIMLMANDREMHRQQSLRQEGTFQEFCYNISSSFGCVKGGCCCSTFGPYTSKMMMSREDLSWSIQPLYINGLNANCQLLYIMPFENDVTSGGNVTAGECGPSGCDIREFKSVSDLFLLTMQCPTDPDYLRSCCANAEPFVVEALCWQRADALKMAEALSKYRHGCCATERRSAAILYSYTCSLGKCDYTTPC